MNGAIDNFRQSLSYLASLGNIYRYLSSVASTAVVSSSLDEILCAELALAVSCLDAYIHDLVRQGIAEIYSDSRPTTKKFTDDVYVSLYSVKASFQDFKNLISSSSDLDSANSNINSMLSSITQQRWLEGEISKMYERDSFQSSGKVENAIKIISDVKIWQELAVKMGGRAEDIKKELDLIVKRRNEIVHEADIDVANSRAYGTVMRYPIDRAQVDRVLKFISDFAENLFLVVK